MRDFPQYVLYLTLGAAAGYMSYLGDAEVLRSYRPAKPNTVPQTTVELGSAQVVKTDGHTSTVVDSTGRTFKIRAIPPGLYRDLRVIDRSLKSYTRVRDKQDCPDTYWPLPNCTSSPIQTPPSSKLPEGP